MSLSDDADLWRRALERDDRAFAELFRRHRDAVLRQALRCTPLEADAEEVAAAAFFELWRLRDRVRIVGGSVLPWLLVTAANLGRNGLRAAKRREVLLRRVINAHDRDTVPSVARSDGLDRIDLVRALRRLPADDAALLTMTALDGLRITDAAAALGLPDGTARMRLHRARARLRALLDDRAAHDLREEPT